MLLYPATMSTYTCEVCVGVRAWGAGNRPQRKKNFFCTQFQRTHNHLKVAFCLIVLWNIRALNSSSFWNISPVSCKKMDDFSLSIDWRHQWVGGEVEEKHGIVGCSQHCVNNVWVWNAHPPQISSHLEISLFATVHSPHSRPGSGCACTGESTCCCCTRSWRGWSPRGYQPLRRERKRC